MSSQRYKFMNVRTNSILQLTKDEISLGSTFKSVDNPTSDKCITLDSSKTGFSDGIMHFGIKNIIGSGRIELEVKVWDLSKLTVGSTFYLGKYQVESEDPWPIEWEIVHQESDYQIAMTKQIIDLRCFDGKEPNNTDDNRKNYGNNNWQYSNIEQFLNSDQVSWYSAQHQYDAPPNSSNVSNNPYDTHKGLLYHWSDNDKALLKDMTLTLANNSVDGGGSYTWTGKVWLPTYTQLGYGDNKYYGSSTYISEGTKFDKYSDNTSRIKTINKYCAENNKYCIDKGYSEGSNWKIYLSSQDMDTRFGVAQTAISGGENSEAPGYGYGGITPCIYLPKTGGLWS